MKPRFDPAAPCLGQKLPVCCRMTRLPSQSSPELSVGPHPHMPSSAVIVVNLDVTEAIRSAIIKAMAKRILTTIGVERQDRDYLKEIAQKQNQTLTEVIHGLVERDRRRQFWRQANQDFARLKDDPDYQRELRELDALESPFPEDFRNEKW
jgi:hypothetical protein